MNSRELQLILILLKTNISNLQDCIVERNGKKLIPLTEDDGLIKQFVPFEYMVNEMEKMLNVHENSVTVSKTEEN